MKKLENSVNYSLKILTRLFLNQKQSIKINNNCKILITANFGIGDCIFFFPVLYELQNLNFKAIITIITNNNAVKKILDTNFPTIETRYIDFNKLGFKNSLKIFKDIKKMKYDIFICNFLGLRNKYIWMALYSVIPNRIGHCYNQSDDWAKYNYFFNYKIFIENKHYIDLNLSLVKPIINNPAKRDIEFILDPISETNIKNFLEDKKITQYVIIQAHSSVGPIKNWPAERYAEIINYIKDHYQYAVLLAGSKSEYEYLKELCKGEHVYNVAGLFDIMETAALIKYASLFVGNDSGIGKISIALNTPTITIWGSSDYTRAKSWSDGHYDLYNKMECAPCAFRIGYPHHDICTNNDTFKCLKSIKESQVKEIVKEVLSTRKDIS